MVNKIVRLMEKKFPDREVELIADLGQNKYLVVAPGKNMRFTDSTNPVYSLDMSTEEVERFDIGSNISKYKDAMSKVIFERGD